MAKMNRGKSALILTGLLLTVIASPVFGGIQFSKHDFSATNNSSTPFAGVWEVTGPGGFNLVIDEVCIFCHTPHGASKSLAVDYDAVLTISMGTTLGMMVSNAIGIVVGTLMGRHIPERAVKWVSALVFIAFGLYGLHENLPAEAQSPALTAGVLAATAAPLYLARRPRSSS